MAEAGWVDTGSTAGYDAREYDPTKVLEMAAYRHRWVLAYRALCATVDRRVPFEPVRVASLESWYRGDVLSDDQIAARVRTLVAISWVVVER